MAPVVPVVLLVRLTALMATGMVSFSRNSAWLFKRQSIVWMAGIVALAAAATVLAVQR